MNLQQERIASSAERLGLHRIAAEWPGLAQDAATKEASYADFLERLLDLENGARLQRQRDILLKLATLPGIKTLEQYDFGFASGAPRAQIQDPATTASPKYMTFRNISRRSHFASRIAYNSPAK